MHEKRFWVYILTNRKHGTLYVGVTNNLVRRSYEHAEHMVEGFTKTYGLNMLVYYECFDAITMAITREKELKSWKRADKFRVIETFNPAWKDLRQSLV
jgi:putative endonuclease